jgi:ATP-binding cassette subfamily B protein
VLDEATSAVDSETESFIQQGIKSLLKGRTSIIIAHRLSTIKAVDRILVLHKGKLVEEGTHEELIKRSSFYKRLHELYFATEGFLYAT